ncbi:invasion associated locus B family protein [Pelagerythrobacter sp.]|uniref:invasion associated locus B family protein n=1 Tax=Pelagerythrobacter sp. TaxID=2800702 RepID=UPI0035AEE5BC
MARPGALSFGALALAALALAAPLAARDSLGMFDSWGAFRDPGVPRCYAIARPLPTSRASDYRAFASVGTWPRRQVRNQLHLRLSRALADGAEIRLAIGDRRFVLTGGGGDAWAADKAMDAAVIAAMRAAGRMTVSARDTRGRRFTDRYDLTGAATAIDAATVGCARVGR